MVMLAVEIKGLPINDVWLRESGRYRSDTNTQRPSSLRQGSWSIQRFLR
jgi:hypothetical protein